jgi:hypothetical protein
MRRRLLLFAVFALTGCPSPGGPSVGINTSALVLSSISNGQITVMGKPGAVAPGLATTVTLTVQRPSNASPGPNAYHLAHLGNHLPVTSSYAALAPDGSFTSTMLGAADRPILPGDELDITPQKGIEEVGYTAFVGIP